ncbi:MAG: thioredoxin family protein [Gammaproteobacteria bacterium]
MALTPSNMPALGLQAPDFRLPDITGDWVSLGDLAASPALLVAFWCNHCPFVKHLQRGFSDFSHDYKDQGLAIVAINANDVATNPEDSPARMRAIAEEFDYCFPYLYDESQAVARAYAAACTPDFFLYDANRQLVYRGQFDDSRPGKDISVTGIDLRTAVDTVLRGEAPATDQKPSIGCNIKWRADNAAA